jgi:hypothetical protein
MPSPSLRYIMNETKEPPILSILIPALSFRPWEEIKNELERQKSLLVDSSSVEILVGLDSGEMTSGKKRNLLVSQSRGKYRAFVDDDDKVSYDYLKRLVDGCKTGADVVTFSVRFIRTDDPEKREVWRLGLWEDDRDNGVMSANPLCAWRRDIADRVSFCPDLGYGDDKLWYVPLIASGIPKTVYDIPSVLYTYVYDPNNTINQAERQTGYARDYFGENGIGAYYRKHAVSVDYGSGPIDLGDMYVQSVKDGVRYREIYVGTPWIPDRENGVVVRDRNGVEGTVGIGELEEFTRVQIE